MEGIVKRVAVLLLALLGLASCGDPASSAEARSILRDIELLERRIGRLSERAGALGHDCVVLAAEKPQLVVGIYLDAFQEVQGRLKRARRNNARAIRTVKSGLLEHARAQVQKALKGTNEATDLLRTTTAAAYRAWSSP